MLTILLSFITQDPLTQKFAKMIVKDSNGMLAEEIMIKLYTREIHFLVIQFPSLFANQKVKK